ncbi:MAG: MMPL family transporter, partial [Deltaproteobacteria bacterium]|nr:MMPL family transporter [Deltaproteobacteria bacterium]
MPDLADLEAKSEFFRRLAAFAVKRRLAVSGAILLAAALLSFGLPGLKVDTSRESWLLEGDKALEARERFEGVFGRGDSCAVLVRGEYLLIPQNLSLIASLTRALESEVPYADEVLSLTNAQIITGTAGGIEIREPVPSDPSQMTNEDWRRLSGGVLSSRIWRNLLLSDDLTESLITLRLKPIGKNGGLSPNEPGAPSIDPALADLMIGEKILEIISRPLYAPLNPIASGMPVIDVEKRAYFGALTSKLIGLTVLIAFLAMALIAKSLKAAFLPLITSILALLSVFGLEGHLGAGYDPLTVFLPVFLAMAMATCYSIHMISRFRMALSTISDRKKAAIAAAGAAGWPLFLSALTTMAGLASFLAIPMRPVRWVGATSAALVGAVFILAQLLGPIFMSLGRDKAKRQAKKPPKQSEAAEKRGAAKKAGRPETKAAKGQTLRPGALEALGALAQAMGKKAMEREKLTLGCLAAAAVLIALGMARLEVSFDFRRTYGLEVPYIARLMEMGESKVGSLYSYGVAIELPREGLAKEPGALKNLKALSEEMRAMELTKRVTSLADIVEDLSKILNDGKEEFRRIPETREEIAQALLLYESAGGKEAERWVDYEYKRLRVQAEVKDYNSKTVLGDLQSVRRRAAELFPEAEIVLTGALSEYTASMDYVTWGQVKTFFLALLSIALVMLLAFGSLKIALVALIPNAIPVLAVSGLMGWLGIPLDVMTVT